MCDVEVVFDWLPTPPMKKHKSQSASNLLKLQGDPQAAIYPVDRAIKSLTTVSWF